MKYFEVLLFRDGKKHILHLKAQSKIDALNRVKNSETTVLKIKEIHLPFKNFFNNYRIEIEKRLLQKQLNSKEFIVFLRHIAVMLKSGVSLQDALVDSRNSIKDVLINSIAESIIKDLNLGKSFTSALKGFEKEVGVLTISMINLGERTGTLSESIFKLIDLLEENDTNRRKIKKAMNMPLISLTTMFIAFITLIVLVIPKFENIFIKMDSDLPIATKILLDFEYLLTEYGLILLVILTIVYLIYKESYRRFTSFKIKVDFLILKVYLFGNISSFGTYSRYMNILSELIKSGISLNEALLLAEETVENSFIKKRLRFILLSIEKGSALAYGFERTRLFPSIVIRMIETGEKGAELDSMIKEIANYYREKFQNIIDNVSTLIEPILMGILSLLVLILALGIFLPMWELSSLAIG